jgi:hypothetical protein
VARLEHRRTPNRQLYGHTNPQTGETGLLRSVREQTHALATTEIRWSALPEKTMPMRWTSVPTPHLQRSCLDRVSQPISNYRDLPR